MRAMGDVLMREVFISRVGEKFRVAETGTELVLAEATSLAVSGANNKGPRREPFSLLFKGPKPVLPQRTWALENETLGRLEIFLVPIGADADGVRYEAIFN
jgi:hypothetical protein